MCIDQDLSERRRRRREVKCIRDSSAESTRSSSTWRMFTGRRGRVNTHLALAALEAGVISVLDDQELSASRLPVRVADRTRPTSFDGADVLLDISPDEVNGLVVHRQLKDKRDSQEWLRAHPNAAAVPSFA
jgi:hypothetical protein